MITKKHLWVPNLPEKTELPINESEIESARNILRELGVPEDEHDLMLGLADELPERFRRKRKHIQSLGVKLTEECGTLSVLKVEIPADFVMDSPIFLLELTRCVVAGDRKIIIEVGENASVSLVVGSPAPTIHSHNPVSVELSLNSASSSHTKLAILHAYHPVTHVRSNIKMKIGGEATVESSVVALHPGRMLIMEGEIDVNAGGSLRFSDTAFLQGDSQKVSWVHVRLNGLDSRAELNSADFNFDESETKTAFFIEVMAGARRAYGEIFSNGLNFSDSARQTFLPGLVTHEEDVELHHGASSGKWTPEQVEYLRSRGLFPKDIAVLLVESLLGARLYPMLPQKLIRYTRCYVERIFRDREITF